MPLQRGKSRAAIGHNIALLRREGRPEKQAVAIALRKAGKARKRNSAGWTQSPILWVGGGAVIALIGYRIWASSKTPASPSPASVVTHAVAPAGTPASTMTPAQIQAALAPYVNDPILFGQKYLELYGTAPPKV